MRGVTAKFASLLVPALRAGIAATLLVSVLPAAEPIKFSGELSGVVNDSLGKPVPGAVVSLFNKQDRLLQRVTVDPQGTFSFSELLPDIYALRVSVINCLPAVREHILVRPGMRSLLDVSMSRIYSAVQIISTSPAPGGLMSDNWKWVLRTDTARRPILRLLPGPAPASSSSVNASAEPGSIFNGSNGLIRVSASDTAQTLGGETSADLGTQFAFATSVYGVNRLRFSGNLAFAPTTGTPSAGIRTSFRREIGDTNPEVAVTVRQLFSPLRPMAGGTSPSDPQGPALRTLAVSFSDKSEITDAISVEYGAELDSVSFLSHLHYFSPFAKISYAIGKGTLDFTWTSGNSRPELGTAANDPQSDLQRELTSLSLIPKVSLMNGQAKVQRGDNYELGLSQRLGSREYRISGYREVVSNAALALSSSGTSENLQGDLLPDFFSNSVTFNAGRFESLGASASVTQDLTQNYKVALAFGSAGVLTPQTNAIQGSSAEDLRRALTSRQRPSVTVRAMGTVKETGTRFATSYEWTDSKSATPVQMYSTQVSRSDPGLNIYVRQPVPCLPGVPWRMEATFDLRNLLAQGYLPLTMADGQRLVLIPSPRSFRGGLAFVF